MIQARNISGVIFQGPFLISSKLPFFSWCYFKSFLLTIPFVALLEMYRASSLKLLEPLCWANNFHILYIQPYCVQRRYKNEGSSLGFFFPNVLTRVLLWSDMDIAMRKESSTDVLYCTCDIVTHKKEGSPSHKKWS